MRPYGTSRRHPAESPTPSHCALERSTVVDAAGTSVREVLFTASRARRGAERRALFGPRHGFAEDVLAFAWTRTVEAGENALAEHLPAFLDALRSAGGDAGVHVELAGLLAAIPALRPPTLDGPFFEDEELAAHLADASDATLAGWDGRIPPDTWFPPGALEEACAALGLPRVLSP